MSASAALPLFGDAYLADTRHLTLEEHGAYLQLMLIAWRSPNCALPDDDKRLATMLGIGAKKWAAIRETVMAFWTLGEHGWQQKRLLKERSWVDDKSSRNRDAAEARWKDKPLKTNKPGDANAYANGYAPPPPPPSVKTTSYQNSARKASKRPDGKGYPEAFEVWWKVYPRKEAKGAAVKAWRSVTADLPEKDLLAATQRYAAQTALWPSERRKFIPHPATWLNDARYEDEAGGSNDDDPPDKFSLGIKVPC